MLKAAEMARPLGGAVALLCALAAGAGNAEPVRPALKPTAPPALSAAAVQEPAAIPAMASLPFQPTEMELSLPAKRDLAALAKELRAKPEARVAVVAYSATAGASMSARRISLGRALAVRSYLIGEGVARGRMIVRALGAPQDGGASERVDIQWLAP